jgi:CTP synthase
MIVQVIIFSFFCQALLHTSVACHRKLIVDWVSAGDLEDITAQEVGTKFYLTYICLLYMLFYKLTIITYLQAPDVYKAAWDLLKVILLEELLAI